MDGSSRRDQLAAEARRLERDGDPAGALSVWNLLAHHNPRDATARTERARITRLLHESDAIDELLTGPPSRLAEAVDGATRKGNYGFVVAVRRRQVEASRTSQTLTALGSALRRNRELAEAETVLTAAIELDPSKTRNRAAYTAYGALLRERQRLTDARELLTDIHALHPDDGYAAEALAAVYLDLADDRRAATLLDEAERLTGVAYKAFGRTPEVSSLYGRLDSLRRQLQLD